MSICSRCRNVNAPSEMTFHYFISIFADQNKASLCHHLFLHPEFHLHRDVLGKKPKKKLRGVSLRRFETQKNAKDSAQECTKEKSTLKVSFLHRISCIRMNPDLNG